MKPYNKNLKQASRDLRNNMTDAEKLLLSRLRNKQILGLQFYRQKPIYFELKKYSNFDSKAYAIGICIDELKEIIATNIDLIQIWSDRIEKLNFNFELKALENAYKILSHEVRDLITKKEKDILIKVNFDNFDRLLESVYKKADFKEYNENILIFNQK